MSIEHGGAVQITLSTELYRQIEAVSERVHQPAEFLLQQAIEQWLSRDQDHLSDRLYQEIAAYAEEFAGTECDLNPEFERASIEHILAQERNGV